MSVRPRTTRSLPRRLAMNMLHRSRWLLACGLLVSLTAMRAGLADDRAGGVAPTGRSAGSSDRPVRFTTDIRPILARHCFACHGPDAAAREADLRLDDRQAAVEAGAITPGKPEDSELIRRIQSRDADERMPPPSTRDTLSDREKALLVAWIRQGAPYETHWAFVPPRRPPFPRGTASSRHPVDRFLDARMQQAGLTPTPPADRHTLIRRLYLDLLGILPMPEEADAFAADPRPDAFERLVDRVLASPRFGERQAVWWLDLARYADSNGYEKDRPRSIWPYRDWVIRALNADVPFDRFSVMQLAGDMLPDAGPDALIATGFHRNTMLNEEGGIDPLEFRFYAMVDRVATTGTVWLGLTVGCAQCHDHKYDPITQVDYYRMMALLNNADEPDFRVPDPDVLRRQKDIDRRIAALEAQLPAQFPPDDGPGNEAQRRQRNLEKHFAAWLAEQHAAAVPWSVLRPTHFETNLPRLELLPDGSLFSTGDITKRDVFRLQFDLSECLEPITALRLEVLPDPRLPNGGPGRAYYEGRKGDFFLSEVTADVDGRPVVFRHASHSYGKISIGSGTAEARNVIDGEGSTGWSTAGAEGQANQLVLNLERPLSPQGTLTLTMLFERHFAASLGRFRWSATSSTKAVRAKRLPVELEAMLAGVDGPEKLPPADRNALLQQFLRTTPLLAEARKRIDALRRQRPELPTTLILRERPPDNPRPTFRHHRGEYLSPRERVEPGLPGLFEQSLRAAGRAAPRNRLQFARWLASRDNPLVGRVTVNRVWRQLFGTGLVRTDGDFGTQSPPPTHPQLLDWLAVEFTAPDGLNWSLKRLYRLLVTSAAYRRSARTTPVDRRRDPENIHYARGARFRLDAEIIRDAMLSAAGILSDRMYGPPVYPPQPPIVTALAYGSPKWTVSTGEDRYRRSVYTFLKRTAPFAAFTVFDAPSRESCTARRNRSNTPLQALTLLNDPMFLELAAWTSERALREAASGSASPAAADPPRVARRLFRLLLTRPPTNDELQSILAFFEAQQRRFRDAPDEARRLLGEQFLRIARDPAATAPGENDRIQTLAAWTLVARALMNTDEAISHQ
ncbi:MAG: DUF1553 domain-containing protein [Planctomycetota bacterium]|nr:MAG: DUF1553 domain-containing protein [Planctomycetota bacterium]